MLQVGIEIKNKLTTICKSILEPPKMRTTAHQKMVVDVWNFRFICQVKNFPEEQTPL